MADSLPTDPVDPDERISRYLLRPKWFSIETQSVFAQAFNPTKATSENPIRQTSVYRTQSYSEPDIWKIGNEYVTKLHRQHAPVLARGDLSASHILDAALQIIPKPDPHPKHANIEGWPNDDEQIEMKLAYLASKAKLKVRPSS